MKFFLVLIWLGIAFLLVLAAFWLGGMATEFDEACMANCLKNGMGEDGCREEICVN
ncbi:MAG: hypothetical protein NC218_11035 [Acetobacter sp.]|nr:hypothetical protein [Acetobacter sp.]